MRISWLNDALVNAENIKLAKNCKKENEKSQIDVPELQFLFAQLVKKMSPRRN